MINKLKDSEVLINKNLGGKYPYLLRDKNEIFYSNSFESALTSNKLNTLKLNTTSIYSMLCFGYIVNDNTLIQNITRLPWRSSIDTNNERTFYDLNEYNCYEKQEREIAINLLEKLEKEFREVCVNKKRIFILISGGMDSRVVAAVLRRLELNKEITAEIHGVTWGIERSRDLVYAKNICQKNGWEWHHAALNEDYLLKNFETSAYVLGGEISPVHLHRFDWFKRATFEDIVIAGSYGDSVGRAEYSSKKVQDVKRHFPNDKFDFLYPNIRNQEFKNLQTELDLFRSRYTKQSDNRINEFEMQAHYMRRMLGNVADVVSNWTNFYQAFTAEETFEFMFSLKYSVRTDKIYEELLKIIDSSLLDIAWARTGKVYGVDNDVPDDLQKNHHRYGYWLRQQCNSYISENLFDGTLESLGIFDISHISRMHKYWLKEPTELHSLLGDKLSWLTVLSLMVKKYNIEGVSEDIHKTTDITKLKSIFRQRLYIIAKNTIG